MHNLKRQAAARRQGADGDAITRCIRAYLGAQSQLRRLGILRTGRPLQADYAEWIAARLLGLRLCDNPIEQHVDAFDAHGRGYQIKGRIVSDLTQATSFDFKVPPSGFEFLVCVFFDTSLKVLGVLLVPYTVVAELGVRNVAGFRFRWNRRVAADRRIKRVFWSERRGLGRRLTSGANVGRGGR